MNTKEKMARALCKWDWEDCCQNLELDYSEGCVASAIYNDAVDLVLDAMRMPSEEVLAAGEQHIGPVDGRYETSWDCAVDAWVAMIGAIKNGK